MKPLLPLYLLAFIILSCGSGQSDVVKPAMPAILPWSKATFTDPLLSTPDSLLRAGNYDDAITHYKLVAEQFRAKGVWEGYVKATCKAAFSYGGSGCDNCRDSAKMCLDRALSTALQKLGPDHPEVAGSHYYLGDYFEAENADSALYHYQKHASIIRQYFHGAPNYIESNTLLAIGEVYLNQLGDFNLAEQYYKQCLSQVEAVADSLKEGDYELAKAYLLIVKSSRVKGDYLQAVPYGEMALRLAKKLPEGRATFVANCHVTVANAHFMLGNYQRAYELYQQGIAILMAAKPESPMLINYYNNISAALIKMNQHGLASEYLLKAIAANGSQDLSELSVSYLNMSQVSKNDVQKSLLYLNKNLDIVQELYGTKHREVANAYNAIADVYLQGGDADQSLVFCQRALIALIDAFNDRAIVTSPDENNLVGDPLLSDILSRKADALKKRYDRDTTQKQWLRLSFDHYRLSMQAMQLNRATYEQTGSKLLLQQQYRKVYENALHTLTILEREDHALAFTSLQLIEQSKSLLLADLIAQRRRLERATLTPAARDLETHLLEALEASRLARSKSGGVAFTEKDSIIFSQENALRKFYSDHQLSNVPNDTLARSTVDPAMLKQYLDSNKVIIDFFWGDAAVHVVYASARGILHREFAITGALNENTETFKRLVSALRVDSLQEDVRQFKEASQALYTQLIKPGETIFSQHATLVVLPDGPLTLLPFEALTIRNDKATRTSFRDLDYLLLHYPVSYGLSCAQLFDERSKTVRRVKSFAAFETIPSPKPVKASLGKIADAYFTAEECSEARLKHILPTHDGLHLTIHGKGSHTSIAGSYLIFNHELPSTQDDTLYAEEIYSYNLSGLALVVLNACETARGKYYEGEGVFSMARGLACAGAQSVVCSLWEIPADASGSVLGKFYERVSEGKSLHTALQESKIAFVREQQDDVLAHPSRWAGLVMQGNTDPVLLERHGDVSSRWMIAMGIVLLLAAAILFQKFRKTSRSRKQF